MSKDPENINVHFFQIVFSLQTAAMQQMGKIVSPATGEVERDMTIAQTTIDILAMLETKMKGNLTDEELHELTTYGVRLDLLAYMIGIGLNADFTPKLAIKERRPEILDSKIAKA